MALPRSGSTTPPRGRTSDVFRIVLRAALTLLLGAPAMFAWNMAMNRLLGAAEPVVGDGPAMQIIDQAVTWMSFVALLMICIYVVYGGLLERQSAGRGI